MVRDVVARTDVGVTRSHNEDAVYAGMGDDWSLLVVADGMGGHTAGDVASTIAIEAFRESVESELPVPQNTLPSLLSNAARDANDHLKEQIADNPGLEGMGTTLVGAVLYESVATIVNVGDSRGYHATAERIEQLTVDQSLVQQLVERGQITEEEAQTHPQRNVVSQALGTTDSIDPRTSQHRIEDYLLLCSDGLTEEVSDERIHQLLTHSPDPLTAVESFIQQANANGGCDNITVALANSPD